MHTDVEILNKIAAGMQGWLNIGKQIRKNKAMICSTNYDSNDENDEGWGRGI